MTDTKHTPTPWIEYSADDEGDIYIGTDDRRNIIVAEKATPADAAFIVHACNNIERVEAENAELKKHNSELLRAARNLLSYRYCLKDGAGREETNAGIERACAALAKAQEK